MQWVIKLGGSLYTSKYLLKWLNILSDCNSENIIIVPGGGPFADQVREADKRFNLDQLHSHNMAVLGMQQFAYVLASLCPKLRLANTVEQIRHYWSQGESIIWEPYPMVMRECNLEKSWQVTSDSLAAWLADHLSAEHLLFVKSAEMILSEFSISNLLKHGCIDSTLPKLLAEMNTSVHFVHKSQVNYFEEQLISS